MTRYAKWLLRSRLISFIGAAMVLGPTLDGFEIDVENSLKVFFQLAGVPVLVIGLLDSFGWIGRKSVKAAIREENERMRGGGAASKV
jgi:hypothetical protein